jgi:type II secretory pathway pseudopilin PulG
MKVALMGCVAAMSLIVPAAQAAEKAAEKDANAEYAALAARVAELEAKQKTSDQKIADQGKTASAGWWNNTSISGRMYYDVTNVSNKANGVRTAGAGNGTNFDIKRFYVGIDHKFNDMFSANVTTDTTYDSGVGNGQVYLKKAFLQARIDPLLTVRVGAADWHKTASGMLAEPAVTLTPEKR